MNRNSEYGFTLLELMIVVIILGILISIAVISISGIREAANTDVCQANQKTIESARMYNYINNGSFGEQINDLSEIFVIIGFLGEGTISDLSCPSGGTYSYINDTAYIECSIGRHN